MNDLINGGSHSFSSPLLLSLNVLSALDYRLLMCKTNSIEKDNFSSPVNQDGCSM